MDIQIYYKKKCELKYLLIIIIPHYTYYIPIVNISMYLDTNKSLRLILLVLEK